MTEYMTAVYIQNLILSIVGMASHSLGWDAHAARYDCKYDDDLGMGSISETRLLQIVEATLLMMAVDYSKELLQDIVNSLVESEKLQRFVKKPKTQARVYYRIVD